MKKALLASAVIAALLTMYAGSRIAHWWQEPAPGVQDILLVGSGASLSTIAAQLAEKDVLRWPRLWTLAARLQGLDARVQRGEYSLVTARSPRQLLQMLVAGDVVTYSVTLAEGLNFRQAFELVQQQEALAKVLTGPEDKALLSVIAPQEHPEGWFFPDTYVFRRGETDLDILRQAHRRMRTALAEAWTDREEGLPYREPYEALIMASIVEKETGLPAERGQIAGVFVRRLQRGMRLQTDPTVIYGLGPDFDGNLRKKHLADDTNLYNTYRHKGLPPTPIALPGREALAAAVRPVQGSALYFVARGDGSHQFSTTLAEHESAVRQYQLTRRKDYRSTPPQGGGS
ncbi:MAG: endolytic transglycosylase MltG [Halieaceae bacterium]|jgi:UPF0755 protein|nr:endolytic transglycosylase MltG [Halieaceae bacterium]